MTAPDDPFRSPTPGSQPPGGDPTGRPVDPYGDTSRTQGDGQSGSQPYGSPQPDQPQPGSQQPWSQQPGSQPYGSQPYGSQPYGSQQYGGGPAFGEHRPAPRNGLGIAALVLGIIALLTGLFVIGGLLGIVAIVLGVMGRSRAKRGEATNGAMAVVGIVLGVLSILLSAAVIAGAASLFDEFSNLSECLESAGGDTAAEQQCRTDFEGEFTN